MTPHSITGYLKYKWNAKTRHGVHSPFVYDFIENVLRSRVSTNTKLEPLPFIKELQLSPSVEKLLLKTVRYYNAASNTIAIKGNDMANWYSIFESSLHSINPQTIIVVADIHKTFAHTAGWEKLYMNQAIKLSIDLYSVGLLFFRDTFKEKQHFILKR